MNPQYDNALLGILQNEGKLERFLDVIFGFLMRRTDFYCIITPEQKKIGFPPGRCIEMVLQAYEKYKTIFENYQQHHEAQTLVDKPKKFPKEVAKKDLTQADPVVVPPSDDNKTESSSKVPISLPGTAEDKECSDEPEVYMADADCYNGAVRDNYTWSQTVKDIDIKIKIPDNVVNARDVSVNIERKHIRIIILQQNGDKTVYFDRDLYWDIHKDDAIWTFDAKENQIHLCLDKVQERWWVAAFVGEDKINPRKIDCRRPIHELEPEAQAKIQQLMYDEHRKRQGLPTSEQEKIQNVLAKAWDKEGSPFRGTQYDPTKVKLQGPGLHIET
uniref:CS domain-containing protein n=1 Tax=Trichobilharzia regenti TaxID=157069 RepID=A0AA85K5X5_TRIRE|nr:unnamed protein product [Trichobilharzia regenti]